MNLVRLLSVPYAQPQEHGFWGSRTSTIDWCEENYVVSPFVAEAVNTCTNAGFIALASYAVNNVLTQGHELRFLFMALGFATVGIGSWLFHMTLLYEFQLLDELPMIYATCIPYWMVFSFGKTRRGSLWVGTQIMAAAVALTAVYLYYRDPTIHQAAYALLNFCVIMRCVYLTRRHVHDADARQQLWRVMSVGVCSFLLGYALWNADIHLCTFWRHCRRSIGMPFGFLLEFHGWWHLFTGVGVYYYLIYLQYLRKFLLNQQHLFRVNWSKGILPHVDQVKPSSKKAHTH